MAIFSSNGPVLRKKIVDHNICAGVFNLNEMHKISLRKTGLRHQSYLNIPKSCLFKSRHHLSIFHQRRFKYLGPIFPSFQNVLTFSKVLPLQIETPLINFLLPKIQYLVPIFRVNGPYKSLKATDCFHQSKR